MRQVTRRLRSLAVLSVAAVALVGCTGFESNPTEYGEVNSDNEGYYGNFMFGCTGVEANQDGEYVDVVLEDPEFCTCVFERLKETVPFSEMQQLEEAQADAEPGEVELPEDVDAARRECAGDSPA